MDINSLVILVFSLIGNVFICIYYLNKKESTCHQCNNAISYKKQNRFYLEIKGKKFAICKKCYNKNLPLKEQQCSCCGKKITSRMKVIELHGETQVYFLCVNCNKLVMKKQNKVFVIKDVFTSSFISSCSSFNCFDNLAEAYNFKLEEQGDFNTHSWNEYIISNTLFSSWDEMKTRAEFLLMQRQNDEIILSIVADYIER